MPRFQDRKSKMLAMKGQSRPVFNTAKGGKASKFGDKGANFNRLRGLQARQQSYSGSNASVARSNQDDAWEGTTGEGDADAGGGEGMGEGQDVVTSPSLDNVAGNTGGGSMGSPGLSPGVTNCQEFPDYPGCESVAEWQWAEDLCNSLIYAAAICAFIGALAITAANSATGTLFGAPAGEALRAIGMLMSGAAVLMGGIVAGLALWMGFAHGQVASSIMFTIGGGFAIAAGLLAMIGDSSKAAAQATWPALGAGISGLVANMLGRL
jgi:hypothetical protein